MKIILSGGGTIGSVTPLLAIVEKMPEAEFLFLGTKNGPEEKLVASKNIKFKSIISAKFRRYFSLQNFIDIFKLELACWQSLFLLKKYKPDLIISAGGYVSVPVVWAGYLLRIPSLVHSQDIKTGLAIKLIKPFAKKITKAFADADLEAEAIGNPARELKVTTNKFNLKNDKPVILITGGGTGALAINKLINFDLLDFTQIIHITGINKNINKIKHPDYYCYQFLKQEMIEAIDKSDLVITRAGLSTLTELATLAKPSIVIPIPDSHQELNAQYFESHHAAVVLNQKELTPKKFNQAIKNLLIDQNKLQELSDNIKNIIKPDATEKLIQIIKNIFSNA